MCFLCHIKSLFFIQIRDEKADNFQTLFQDQRNYSPHTDFIIKILYYMVKFGCPFVIVVRPWFHNVNSQSVLSWSWQLFEDFLFFIDLSHRYWDDVDRGCLLLFLQKADPYWFSSLQGEGALQGFFPSCFFRNDSLFKPLSPLFYLFPW